MASPIEQFEIKTLFSFGELAGQQLTFTNSAAFMVLTVVTAAGFMLLGSRPRAIVPGRFQSAVEMTYLFIEKSLKDTTGNLGMRFFPFVFTLFMFILFANMLGVIPYSFTVTSHIAVTFALSLSVFLMVTVYGVYLNGFRFFRLFLPEGIPIILAPFIVPIEIVSYLSRPISHAVRLFAVMLAGHITLKVFASFVVSLAALGAGGVALSVLPLFMAVVMTGMEVLMAFLQAYVFTMLTCMYLNDALHPSH